MSLHLMVYNVQSTVFIKPYSIATITLCHILHCVLSDFSWIPTCAKLFIDKKEYWWHLVPQDDSSTELAQEFFACVAAVMSIQLRGMVIDSLADFLEFFKIHKVRQRVNIQILNIGKLI